MIFCIAIFVLAALLQWWLAGRKSRIPGLILPIGHLLLSIVLILSLTAYSFVGNTAVSTVISNVPENGTLVIEADSGEILASVSTPVEVDGMDDGPTSVYTAEEIEATPGSAGSIGIIGGADGPTAIFVTGGSDWPMLIGPFLLLNIPSAVYLILYCVRRGQLKKHSIDKTRIQDL